MSEDLPAEKILKQIVERLDLLERVLGANTARLHLIEHQLGIVRQPFHDRFVDENGEVDPAASAVKTQDLISEATQPAPVSTQACELPEQTWLQPEAEPAEETWLPP